MAEINITVLQNFLPRVQNDGQHFRSYETRQRTLRQSFLSAAEPIGCVNDFPIPRHESKPANQEGIKTK